jgi:hypothetical protein
VPRRCQTTGEVECARDSLLANPQLGHRNGRPLSSRGNTGEETSWRDECFQAAMPPPQAIALATNESQRWRLLAPACTIALVRMWSQGEIRSEERAPVTGRHLAWFGFAMDPGFAGR